MKYILTLFLLSCISLETIAQEQIKSTDTRLAGIDSLLNKVLKDQQIAGFSVAVVDGDSVIYSKGFGYRDLENKKPVTSNTLFAIGSSSKAFTAALLGMLQKEGKLSLDGNAVSYLPQLRFFNENMNNQITIRDMMTHRTGLSRYDLSWYLFNTSSRDSMIRRVQYMEPNVGLREKWQYNNFMYLAQGMIAEKLTGKTWEQNIKDRFFVPLEMKRSNTSIVEFQNDSIASLPYKLEDNQIKKMDYYDISGMGPAGAINSSADDMANWIKLWIAKGNYKGKEILSPAYITEAASSQMVIGSGLPTTEKDIYMANYGLGWIISSYRGHYKVEHGGNIDGFSASVSFFPTDKLGVVVLTNQNTSQVPTIVLNSIVDKLFKLKPIDWNGKVIKAKLKAKEINTTKKETDLMQVLNTKPSHPLTEYTGVFTNPAYGLVDISLKNDSLLAKVGKRNVWLKHYHYDTFDWKLIDKYGKTDTSENSLKLNFSTNVDGKIENLSASIEPGMKPAIFSLKPKVVYLDAKTLEQYVGDYTLVTTQVKVSVREKVLYVYLPGQPEYETIALGNHNFDLKTMKGFSVRFELNAEGKAEAIYFIQPNGTFKATRKNE
ncbi:serine hydrolase [Pedobacter hiemivivus]|uniref:Serine hydrolase n=1 Tax=Pedobacter hiemivivus TaxID=2530454 RepID=A0A4U1GE49_9SPHI|nr:serine hydrolase [Pedobacter hiemivivus]TKC62345.1 serine hydrolase [Pedobacter hiemivivus]